MSERDAQHPLHPHVPRGAGARPDRSPRRLDRDAPAGPGPARGGVRGRLATRQAMSSLIYRPEYANYSFGEDHPFSPLRVRMALELLEALGHRVDATAPEPARREDLLSVHDDYYVDHVEALSAGRKVPNAQELRPRHPRHPGLPGDGRGGPVARGRDAARRSPDPRGDREAGPAAGGRAAPRAAQLRVGLLRLQRPGDRDPLADPARPVGRLPRHRRPPRGRRPADPLRGQAGDDDQPPRVGEVPLPRHGRGPRARLGSRSRAEAERPPRAAHRGGELPRGPRGGRPRRAPALRAGRPRRPGGGRRALRRPARRPDARNARLREDLRPHPRVGGDVHRGARPLHARRGLLAPRHAAGLGAPLPRRERPAGPEGAAAGVGRGAGATSSAPSPRWSFTTPRRSASTSRTARRSATGTSRWRIGSSRPRAPTGSEEPSPSRSRLL